MSRLYMKINTDTRKTTLTSTGRQRIEGRILYEGEGGRRSALDFVVSFPKGAACPEVSVTNNCPKR